MLVLWKIKIIIVMNVFLQPARPPMARMNNGRQYYSLDISMLHPEILFKPTKHDIPENRNLKRRLKKVRLNIMDIPTKRFFFGLLVDMFRTQQNAYNVYTQNNMLHSSPFYKMDRVVKTKILELIRREPLFDETEKTKLAWVAKAFFESGDRSVTLYAFGLIGHRMALTQIRITRVD